MQRRLAAIFISVFLTLSLASALHPQKVAAYSAQCAGYWVGMVNSASSVDKVACVSSYDEGISVMGAQASTAASVASLFHDDTIVASRYATLDFTTTGSSSVNSYAYAVYSDGTLAASADYFNGYYGAEGPYLSAGSSETAAVTYISGLKASVNKTRGNYTQYAIVPVSVAAPLNYYVAEPTGSLRHYFAYFSSQSSIAIGVAPDFLTVGAKYYSPDGHYFYSDYLAMIDDLNAGSRRQAANQVPWYNYYQFLPFHSSSNYTAQDIDNYLIKCGYTTLAYTYYSTAMSGMGRYPLASESLLYGTGSYFIQAEQEYGINPLLLMTISVNESAWGRSYISIVKNNLFGVSAYDSSTSSAASYDSPMDSIYAAAGILTGNYLDAAANAYYYGAFLGNKEAGVNVKYASDPYWGEKAAAYYYQFDLAMGLKDYDTYTLGVTNTESVRAYNSPAVSTKYPYNYNANSRKITNSVVLIAGESGDFYRVMADVSLDTAADWPGSGFSTRYDFENNFRYVRKSDLTVVNAKASYAAPANSAANNSIRLEHLPQYNTLRTNAAAPVYTDAYLSNPVSVTLAEGAYLAASERSYTSAGDYSYKVIYDLASGSAGWIAASGAAEVTGSYAVKNNPTHDAIAADVYSSVGGSRITGVTYNFEYISIISTETINGAAWYKITADPRTGAIGYTAASGYGEPVAHTAADPADPDPVDPDDPALPDLKDLTYSPGMYYLDSISLNADKNAVTFRGLLAITGMPNAASTKMAFELILENESTGAKTTIPLDRWTDSAGYPYDVNSVPGVSFDYSGAWFAGTVDFADTADGNYTLTLVAKNATNYTSQLLTNAFSKDIAQRFVNAGGTGIELRTDYLLKSMPLELFVRHAGLLAGEAKPTLDNAFVDYSALTLSDGLLKIRGTAFNVKGEYKASAAISRSIVFENVDTFQRYSFDVGSTDRGNYTVTLRVPDGLDKSRAWFDASLDLSGLAPGKYAIYVVTAADNGLTDYGELTDVFCRPLDASMSLAGKTYQLSLNTGCRYRIELTVSQ